MKWFWGGFWLFLIFLTTTAAIMRPDTVDATLAFVGSFLTVAAWTLFIVLLIAIAVGGGSRGVGLRAQGSVEELAPARWPLPAAAGQTAQRRCGDHRPERDGRAGRSFSIAKTGSAYEHEPAAGWQVQATIRAMVESTSTAQAMFQGDESRSSRWGSEHRGDRITAAAVRLMDSPRQQPAMPQPATRTARPASAARAHLDARGRHRHQHSHQAGLGRRHGDGRDRQVGHAAGAASARAWQEPGVGQDQHDPDAGRWRGAHGRASGRAGPPPLQGLGRLRRLRRTGGHARPAPLRPGRRALCAPSTRSAMRCWASTARPTSPRWSSRRSASWW
jgi:hypothetical protein